MIAAIRRQAGFVGACAFGGVIALMLVLATGNDPVLTKLSALSAAVLHLFH